VPVREIHGSVSHGDFFTKIFDATIAMSLKLRPERLDSDERQGSVFQLHTRVVRQLDSAGHEVWGVKFAGGTDMCAIPRVLVLLRRISGSSAMLLIGNVFDSLISEFDLSSGSLLGQLADDQDRPLSIAAGFVLWGLAFGTVPHANGKPNQLFFTAGPTFPPHTGKYTEGRFGVIIASGHGQLSSTQ
jgi:hypothetical protein